MSKIFIDTNILIYSLDQFDKKKQEKSRNLLRSLENTDQGILSTQIIQEFFVAATKKLKSDPLLIKTIIKSLTRYEIVLIDMDVIDQAIDISLTHPLSFWDSLVIAAAHHAHCDILWSEDLNEGQIIHGVEIINPFNLNQP